MRDGQLTMVAGSASSSSNSAVPSGPTDQQLLERFTRSRDADAFATLIRRHGPMVLGVCRRIVGDEQEAEDAFQTTFLILVRKIDSLARPELLGNWLYGVAYRIASKTRARLARRRHQPLQVEPMATSDPHTDLHSRELRSLIDEELQTLPVKYRAPLVLCYLEGLTNEEAARRLGWPIGSMSYRLARGRQLLGDRLRSRRALLSGSVFTGWLNEQTAPVDVPVRLAESTLKAVLAVAGRRPNVPPLVPRTGPLSGLLSLRFLATALVILGLAAGVFAYAALGGPLGGSSNSEPAPGAAEDGAVVMPAGCH
jgi:RNA polymerase sigma factor (sigma-70 family)